MSSEDRQRTRFDEQAALEELERLQRSIEGYRRQRREVLDEFDRFTRSFRSPAAEPAPDPAPAALSPASIAPVLEQQAVEQSPAEQQPRRLRPAVALGFVTALLALGVVFSRSWRSAPSEPGVQAPSAATLPAVAAPHPSAVEAGGIQAELSTLRRVWVRVLVDGERTVERELQAGVRIPLRAERTIAIRTGDAGAVHLVVDGGSRGPLGRDGEVVTRTFTARPPARR